LENFVEGVVFGPGIGYASFVYGEEVDAGVGRDLAGRRDGTDRAARLWPSWAVVEAGREQLVCDI
jgi:hypothetical protein